MQKQIQLLENQLANVTKETQRATPPNTPREDKQLNDALDQIKRLEAQLAESKNAANPSRKKPSNGDKKPAADDDGDESGGSEDDEDDDSEEEFLMTPSGQRVLLLNYVFFSKN